MMKTRINMACEAWDDWLIYNLTFKCRHNLKIVREMMEIRPGQDVDYYGFYYFIERNGYLTHNKLSDLTTMALALWCVWPELGVDE